MKNTRMGSRETLFRPTKPPLTNRIAFIALRQTAVMERSSSVTNLVGCNTEIGDRLDHTTKVKRS